LDFLIGVASYNDDPQLWPQADTPNASGATPLHVAASAAAAGVLLAAGASVDVRNNAGATALVAAAERGAAEVARTLLLAGADINTQDDCGETALIRACSRCAHWQRTLKCYPRYQMHDKNSQGAARWCSSVPAACAAASAWQRGFVQGQYQNFV